MKNSSIPFDPYDFERWCAEAIDAQGWTVTETPLTGDQGIDLLVERDSVVVAIQCKATARPAGTASVQQAIAGMHFSNADYSCTISLNGYTPGARALAKKSHTELIDAENIERFSQIFGFSATKGGERSASSLRPKLKYERPEAEERYIKVDFLGESGHHIMKGLEAFVKHDNSSVPGGLIEFYNHNIEHESLNGSGVLSGEEIIFIAKMADLILTQDTEVNDSIIRYCSSHSDPRIKKMLKDNPKTIKYYQLIDKRVAAETQRELAKLIDKAYANIAMMGMFSEAESVDLKFLKIRFD